MGKILFIPSLAYLSYPIFIEVSKHLDKKDLVYFDPEFTEHSRTYRNYQKKLREIRQFFAEVIWWEGENSQGKEEPLFFEHPFQKIRFFFWLRKKHKNILQKIRNINPEVIVLGADGTDQFKICNTFFSDKKLFILQQGSLSSFQTPVFSLREKISYLFYRYFLQVPLFPSNPWQPYQDHFTHLLWSDFFHLKPYTQHIATGNPSWDHLLDHFNRRILITGSLKKYHQQLIETKTICYTTQPIEYHVSATSVREFYSILKNTFKTLNEFRIIVKVHPREDPGKYVLLFPSGLFPNLKIIHKEKTLHMILDHCFLMITAWSMTAYETMAKGLPVIIVNPGNTWDYSFQFPANTISVATNEAELIEEVLNLTEEKKFSYFLQEREQFLQAINTQTAGKAAETIATIIRKSIGVIHRTPSHV